MGIPHIDTLEVSYFIDLVRRLINQDNSLELSVKIDGSANLGFGLDEDGKLYFSREVKGQPEKKRSPDAWPKKPMYNALRAAAAALLGSKEKIESLLQPNDYIVCEVLFEAYPNAIEYGNSMIVFHDVKYQFLVSKLKKISGNVDLYFYDFDTKQIEKKVQDVEFVIGGKTVINTGQYQVKSIEPDLKKLEAFVSQKNKVFKDLSNLEVLALRAAGEWAPQIKKEKERLTAVIARLQLKVKSSIINSVLNRLPSSDIAPPPVFDKHGNNIGGSWPEGIVIKDLNSGDLSKVVSVFPLVNKFLWKYREIAMKGIGKGEERIEGIVERFKRLIADDVFKIPLLKVASVIHTINRQYRGKPANEKLLFLLRDKGFQFNKFNSAKSAFIKCIEQALKELDKLQDEFETQGKTDTLKLRHGTFHRDVRYTDIHIRKTYETFVMIRQEFEQMRQEVRTINQKTNEGRTVELLRIFLCAHNTDNLSEQHEIVADYLIENIIVRLMKEARGKKVGMMIGRFQPPTIAHFQLIKNALHENDVVYVFVAGQKESADNPFPYEIRKEILSYLRNVVINPAGSGFAPGLIEDNIDLNGVSLVNLYCGTDRVAGYKTQMKEYFDHEGVAWKVKETKRDPDSSVSGTKVRYAIASGDFNSFSGMMATEIPDRKKRELFKKLQKLISKYS